MYKTRPLSHYCCSSFPIPKLAAGEINISRHFWETGENGGWHSGKEESRAESGVMAGRSALSAPPNTHPSLMPPTPPPSSAAPLPPPLLILSQPPHPAPLPSSLPPLSSSPALCPPPHYSPLSPPPVKYRPTLATGTPSTPRYIFLKLSSSSPSWLPVLKRHLHHHHMEIRSYKHVLLPKYERATNCSL